MGLFATVVLVNALTFPIPADLDLQQESPIYDSEDLYGEEPSIIAMEPSAVRNRLHSLGFEPITDMRFTGGRWKVRAYWMGKKRKLEVDENTGMILSDRPDRN